MHGTLRLTQCPPMTGGYSLHTPFFQNRSDSPFQVAHVSILISWPCLFFIKAALFLFYIELFGILRWLRYLAWFGMTFHGLFYTAAMIVISVTCSPRTGQERTDWLAATISPKCPYMLLPTVSGAVNVLSDFYLLILPLPALWRLHLPTRKKLEVLAVVLTGSM